MPIRVNRRFLYWGVVLSAIGGVLVAADLGAVDTPTLTDALRLWPLAVSRDSVADSLRPRAELTSRTLSRSR